MEELAGLDEGRLNNLLLVELELNLCACYENSATLGSVQSFIDARGLELCDMRSSRGARPIIGDTRTYDEAVFGVPAISSSVAARLNEVDLLFFRRASSQGLIGNPLNLRKNDFYASCE